MPRLKIYSPPAAAIDWEQLNTHVKEHWATQYEMNKQMSFAASTRNNVWHGRPVGLIPFLRLCKAVGTAPLIYLMER